MIKSLISRPVGVFLSFLALCIFSVLALKTLPIALLPSIEVPVLMIKVNYPNASPQETEENTLKIIRESLKTTPGILSMESKASDESGFVELQFEHGTSMSLAYIDINEKIDRLTHLLPKELERPQVIKVNTTDIPIMKLHVTPRLPNDYLEISNLTEKVIKKRIEQLEGVSLVDINGLRQQIISIQPDLEKMHAYQVSHDDIRATLEENNAVLGGISVKSGQYRYYIKMRTESPNPQHISQLKIQTANQQAITLHSVCSVQFDESEKIGYQLFNQNEALVVNIHKQANAQVTTLAKNLKSLIATFPEDYTKAHFEIAQDQSELINMSISNLVISLLMGGTFAFLVLFFFMSDIRSSIIIGISLPVSLLISFCFFYCLNISINIISLSGLALGLGMLIDNAIVVLDSIAQKRTTHSLAESCSKGTKEVASALTSSVLSTLSVFIPLIFLSGLAGAIFFDQAIAVSIILTVSLGVSFILIPTLYYQFNLHQKNRVPSDHLIFEGIKKLYTKGHQYVFDQKKAFFIFIIVLLGLSLAAYHKLTIEGFPPLASDDLEIKIDWNEPISLETNKQRITNLLTQHQEQISSSAAEIGLTQFLLNIETPEIQQATVYIKSPSPEIKSKLAYSIRSSLAYQYHQARVVIEDSPNAFSQIFTSSEPELEIRLRKANENTPISVDEIIRIQSKLKTFDIEPGNGLASTSQIVLNIRWDELQHYSIDYIQIEKTLKRVFGREPILNIHRYGEKIQILFKPTKEPFEVALQQELITNRNGEQYILSDLIAYELEKEYKAIHADESGIYQSFSLPISINVDEQIASVQDLISTTDLLVNFKGRFFENEKNLKELTAVLAISVLLLYFILAAQFESFTQPLIVITTLPICIGGSLLLLWLVGYSINIMSLIGIIVMLGIIVNDSILKIDTINMLRREEKSSTKETLLKSIKAAGELRLKPILMTSSTTILALCPILFTDGMGSDLQKPLAFTVIGGLALGTLLSIYLVPLLYYATAKKDSQT